MPGKFPELPLYQTGNSCQDQFLNLFDFEETLELIVNPMVSHWKMCLFPAADEDYSGIFFVVKGFLQLILKLVYQANGSESPPNEFGV